MVTMTNATQVVCGEHGQPIKVESNFGFTTLRCDSGCQFGWSDVAEEPGTYCYVRDGFLWVEDVTDEAYESGRSRGYDHANYVSAYGGDVRAEPKRDEIPVRFQNARSWFMAGWAEGVEQYENDQHEG